MSKKSRRGIMAILEPFDLSQPGFSFFGNLTPVRLLEDENEVASSDDSAGEKSDDKQESTDEGYLTLGEKLISLARELMPRHRKYTDIEEKLAQLDLNDDVYFDANINKLASVIRRVIKSAGKENGKIIDDPGIKALQAAMPDIPWVLGTFNELFESPVEENFTKTGIVPKSDFFSIGFSGYLPRDFVLKRKWCGTKKGSDPNEKVLYLYCPRLWKGTLFANLQMGNNCSGRHFRNAPDVHLEDLSKLLAYVYTLNCAYKSLKSEYFKDTVVYKKLQQAAMAYTHMLRHPEYDRRLRMSDIFNSQKEGNLEAVAPKNLIDSTVFIVDSKFRGNAADFSMYSAVIQKVLGCKRVVFLDRRLPENPEDSNIYYAFENLIDSKEALVLKELWIQLKGRNLQSAFDALSAKHENIVIYKDLDIFAYFISKLPSYETELVQEFCSILIDGGILDGGTYMDTRLGRRAVPLPYLRTHGRMLDGITELVAYLFYGIHEVERREVEEIKKEMREQKEHARSFETKRNIPMKILKIMKESVLNERFGYIEYDELCDTEKIGIVNAQLMSFINEYFPDFDLKSVSLRFRRLGNHKASGLYYPFYKCICVDIKQPSSFVHEFGHMLDYLNGNLSDCMRSEAFAGLCSLYKGLIDEKLKREENARFAEIFAGKSKYNKDYYTDEREVFARCFEMYIYTKLGPNLRLVGAELFLTFILLA